MYILMQQFAKAVLLLCDSYSDISLFSGQDVEAENNTLVIVLGCDVAELRLLLTFMYTGEVTASKKILPSLLRLAQTLKVSGLTDADTVRHFLFPLELCSNLQLQQMIIFFSESKV